MDKRSQDQFRSMSRVKRTSPYGHSVLAARVNLRHRLSAGEFLERGEGHQAGHCYPRISPF